MEHDIKTKEQYKTWKKLINMSANEIQKFLDSDEGKEAGLSRKEAATAGAGGGKITSGRDSARAIIRMLGKKFEDWTENDLDWMKAQISFISRMKANPGQLLDDKGRKTRKLLSLLVWGHDPRKKMNESEINNDEEQTLNTQNNLSESDEKKERVSTVPSDIEILWAKFSEMVNMTSAQLRSFYNSEDGKESGWTDEERNKESLAATTGRENAKELINILSKYSSNISNGKAPKNLTQSERECVSRSIRFIARVRENIGGYKDKDGKLTPKAKALMLRAFDPIKAGNKKLPSTQEVKQELKKEMEKKINEAVDLANLFL